MHGVLGPLGQCLSQFILIMVPTLTLACSAKAAVAPTVIQTTPVAGTTDADPTLTEIRVEFDQPMHDGSWSWVGGGPKYPETTGAPRYESEQVAVLPVQLEPEHEYQLSVNSSRYKNFVSQNGVSATPYVLEFTTGPWPDGVEPPPLPEAPKVVTTVPQAGAMEVDPALREIRVVFDQPMQDRSWSWVGGGDKFPGVEGEMPRYETEFIAVLPVSLEPNHDYWLSINSTKFTNFRSREGEAATPYVIEFRTGPGE